MDGCGRGRGCEPDRDEKGGRGHPIAHAKGAVDKLGAESGEGNKKKSDHKEYSYRISRNNANRRVGQTNESVVDWHSR